MIAEHTTTIHAVCPVDGRWDYYEVTVTCSGTLRVETIEAVLDKHRGRQEFQEGLARAIKEELPGVESVTLTGWHGKQTRTVVKV